MRSILISLIYQPKLVVFITLLFLNSVIQAQVTFQKSTFATLPSTPEKMAKGDFDNDGKTDFVVCNFNSLSNRQLTLILNKGTAAFAGYEIRNFGSGINALNVAVGDFNKDGNLDVVSLSQSNDNFSLLLGDGTGNLAAPINFTVGDTPQGIEVADFNKDGNTDVIVSSRGTPNDVRIFLGNGTGGFAAPTVLSISPVFDIAVADFNKDTNPDFAVVIGLTVQIWFGDGSGSNFSVGPTISGFGLSGQDVLAADLDADGDADIVASSGYALNDGTGNFAPRVVLFSTGYNYTVGDLNKDGLPDIIANDGSGNGFNARVFLGIGSGLFSMVAKFELSVGISAMLVSDLNNDSNPDLITVGVSGSTYRSEMLFGDGTGFFTNTVLKYPFPTGYNPQDIVKGDFNKDGKIDVAICHAAANLVTVHLGEDGNRFTKTATNYNTGTGPFQIIAVDYNNDTNLDIITYNNTSGSVTVLTGNGVGEFTLLGTISTSGTQGRMTYGDFNNDTFLDLAVTNGAGQSLSILNGTGTGFSAPSVIPLTERAYEIKSIDLNKDGNLDLVADYDSGLGTFFGNGNGTFNISTSRLPVSGSFFLIADINYDTHDDVIAFANSAFGNDFFINDGTGVLTGSSISVTLGGFPYAFEDMDGDGFKDLVVGSQSPISSNGGQIVVFRGTATGVSTSILIDQDGSGGSRFIVHDLNADGRLDIVATSYYTAEDYFSVLINTTVSAGCPGIISQSPSASVCTGESFGFTVSASGSAPLAYQWRKDGIDIPGQTSASIVFLVTALTDVGTYSCRVSNGCGSVVSSNAILTVSTTPDAPDATGASGCEGSSVTLTASGASNGQYRWYILEEGTDPYGNPITEVFLISGQTNSTYTTSALTETTEFLVAINNGTCESNPTLVEATINNCNGTPPVITSIELATQSGQIITLDLVPLIVITNGSLDLASLEILEQPASGAIGSINASGVLTINYAGINFFGTESITIRACDTNGLCAEQVFTIEVNEGIEIYNAVSANDDDKNPYFRIDNLELLEPNNTVTIYNRWGSKVFEVENYSEANAFKGLNQNGNELPSGTYFYKIFLNSSGLTRTGYLMLKR
jgi:gliding motility-associated-like protein